MMKKKMLVFVIMIALMLCLSGCKKPNFSVRCNEDMSVEIIAENAKKGMWGAASGFDIEEGQKIYVESFLSKGEINVIIEPFDLGIDAAIEELNEALSGNNALLNLNLNGNKAVEYELDPGSYGVNASVLKNADGNILITIR